MPTYFTSNRHGYSCRFSPFHPNKLAVASSQFYGLAGGGTLFILDLNDNGIISLAASYQWSDGLFDVVWSEENENIIVSVSGDGSIQLWNVNTDSESGSSPLSLLPQMIYKEHKKEIYSIDWSRTRREQFVLTASWDCTIKLWDPNRTNSLSTYVGHSPIIYNAMFSPHIPNTFASVGGDGYLKIWNLFGFDQPIASIKAHDGEILTCDWSKFDANILATGSSDGLIRGFDIRNFGVPVFELRGAELAIRRLQFSPFAQHIIASVGYDGTTRLWNYKENTEAIEVIKQHSEFNYGLDWNSLRKNQLADCGWDSLVHIFSPKSLLESN